MIYSIDVHNVFLFCTYKYKHGKKEDVFLRIKNIGLHFINVSTHYKLVVTALRLYKVI